ncbi:MAG: hypothetical protein GX444_20950 [Myxococcales bacterium]|nr:hypothetical protein [Myxococcales bacterium]
MRKVFVCLTIVALAISLAGLASAEVRDFSLKKIPFGTYHKCPAGMNLNYVSAKWDANGLNNLQYQVSVWQGKFTLMDVYVVTDEKVVYKRSQDKKLGMDFSKIMNTAAKEFNDTAYFTKPIAPFNIEKSEIWWLVNYVENNETKEAVVIWKMKDNTVDWKPFKPQQQ